MKFDMKSSKLHMKITYENLFKVDEITDEEVLRRVAVKLRNLIHSEESSLI